MSFQSIRFIARVSLLALAVVSLGMPRWASAQDSKEVVRICTVYAQKGMWNIFIVVFCFALALPFFNAYFFIGYLIGMAFFGLFQAIFMANAGGAWDNAKKIVEVELRQKGTEVHAAIEVFLAGETPKLSDEARELGPTHEVVLTAVHFARPLCPRGA